MGENLRSGREREAAIARRILTGSVWLRRVSAGASALSGPCRPFHANRYEVDSYAAGAIRSTARTLPCCTVLVAQVVGLYPATILVARDQIESFLKYLLPWYRRVRNQLGFSACWAPLGHPVFWRQALRFGVWGFARCVSALLVADWQCRWLTMQATNDDGTRKCCLWNHWTRDGSACYEVGLRLCHPMLTAL